MTKKECVSECHCCGLVDYSKPRPQPKVSWTTAAIVIEKLWKDLLCVFLSVSLGSCLFAWMPEHASKSACYNVTQTILRIKSGAFYSYHTIVCERGSVQQLNTVILFCLWRSLFLFSSWSCEVWTTHEKGDRSLSWSGEIKHFNEIEMTLSSVSSYLWKFCSDVLTLI